MTVEQPEEQPVEQPEKQPPVEQPEEQPEDEPDVGGEGSEGLRLVSQLAGAAVSVPVVTGFVLLGAAVLVGRSLVEAAGETRRQLSSLRTSQRDRETSTPRAA